MGIGAAVWLRFRQKDRVNFKFILLVGMDFMFK